MKEQTVYDRIRQRSKPETKRYVQKNLAVVAEVSRLMKEKGWTQNDLAKKLGKTNSEVSKWLSGLHNLTLKSIAKLEAVLDTDLLEVPQKSGRQTHTAHYVVMRIGKPSKHSLFTKSMSEETVDFEDVSSELNTMIA